MAAGLGNTKNIFSSPYDNTRKLGAYYLKMSWAEGSFSDPMTILNSYQYWKTRFDSKEYSRKERNEEIEWARTNNIQLKALKVQDGYFVARVAVLQSFFFVGHGLSRQGD